MPPEAPDPQPLQREVSPIDPRDLRRVGGAMGSNPAGVFEAADGQRYYVKTLQSPAHARNERMAAALYRLAGAPTLTYVPTARPDQVATALVKLDKRCIAEFSEAERRTAQRYFGVHAWAANWDAAGYAGDNQAVVADAVVTLDVGGALLFRGQGDPKDNAFGVRVDELTVMRCDPGNPWATRLFGDMSEAQLVQAVARVTRLSDAAVRAVVVAHGGRRKLIDKLLARKADMLRRFPAALDAPRPP